MNKAEAQIIAYIPVIHRGYLAFLRSHPEATNLWLLPKEYTDTFRFLQKDIRSLEPAEIVVSLTALQVPQEVSVLEMNRIDELLGSAQKFLLPDEDVSRAFVEKFLHGQEVEFASVFLRWDTSRSLASQEIQPDEEILRQDFDLKMMRIAQELARKSPDWWRQVGALVVKNDRALTEDSNILFQTYNQHLPHPQEPYIVGDPRANFHQGEHIDKSTALHAEASLIAQAARQGTSLEGASMYVTTFPCPYCAKLIAQSGVATLYYYAGYSMVDGAEVIRRAGVRIVRVVDK